MSDAPIALRAAPLNIVAEGDGWLALNKPAGASFHSENSETGYFAHAESELGRKLWPVHRLDKVTSGLLLVATNAEKAAFLAAQFAERTTSKFYLAISQQRPQKKQGKIIGDMVKSRNGSYRLTRTNNNPAVTRFLSYYDEQSKQRVFLLKPQTGKTHQLRVAMKSLGAPILGDSRYGGEDADRTYLHSWCLQFHDGDNEQTLFAEPVSGQWPTLPAEWTSPAALFS